MPAPEDTSLKPPAALVCGGERFEGTKRRAVPQSIRIPSARGLRHEKSTGSPYAPIWEGSLDLSRRLSPHVHSSRAPNASRERGDERPLCATMCFSLRLRPARPAQETMLPLRR